MATNQQAMRVQHRRGLPVSLAMSISHALRFISEGRIEKARIELETALLYADTVHSGVSEHVGLTEVRKGNGLEI